MIWLLENAYGFQKSEISPVIDQLLRTAQFKIFNKDLCWKAFADFSQKNGDFADYYIGRSNERDGAAVTLTFDNALKDSEIFLMLSDS
jgi:predicted nucleic-acid-binding protein